MLYTLDGLAHTWGQAEVTSAQHVMHSCMMGPPYCSDRPAYMPKSRAKRTDAVAALVQVAQGCPLLDHDVLHRLHIYVNQKQSAQSQLRPPKGCSRNKPGPGASGTSDVNAHATLPKQQPGRMDR